MERLHGKMITEPIWEWIKHVLCVVFFFSKWENQIKMGTLFWVVLFWASKRKEEMLGPRKAEHLEWEPECFLPPHLTDFQRQPPPQCWETLIPMAPAICRPSSSIPLQLWPACLGLSTCPRVLAIERVAAWPPHMSQAALPDSETSLLALWWSLDPGKSVSSSLHQGPPYKGWLWQGDARYIFKPWKALHKYMNAYVCQELAHNTANDWIRAGWGNPGKLPANLLLCGRQTPCREG